MAKTKRKWIILDWLLDGCLRAQDIPYNALLSIKGAIDAIVFGKERQDEESLALSTTTSTSFQEKLSLVTGTLIAGQRYRVGWYFELNSSKTNSSVYSQVQALDSITIQETIYEPKDSNNWIPIGGFGYFTPSTDQVVNFDIDYRAGGGNVAGIRNARLELWRVE